MDVQGDETIFDSRNCVHNSCVAWEVGQGDMVHIFYSCCCDVHWSHTKEEKGKVKDFLLMIALMALGHVIWWLCVVGAVVAGVLFLWALVGRAGL